MLIRLGGGRTPGGTEKHRPCAWPGPWYGSWPRMTARTFVERAQVERPKPVGCAWKIVRPSLPLGQQELFELAHIGLLELAFQRFEPTGVKPDRAGRHTVLCSLSCRMESLVSTNGWPEHLGFPDLVVVDCSWHMPASGGTAATNISRPIFPARGSSTSTRSATPPTPLRTCSPPPDSSPMRWSNRDRQRRPHNRLRQFAASNRGSRLVHASPFRSPTSRDPRRRLRHVAGRRPAGRKRRTEVKNGHPLRSARTPRPKSSPKANSRRPRIAADRRSRRRPLRRAPSPTRALESRPATFPGARNLPYSALYNEDGTFRSRDELRRLFEAAGPSRSSLSSRAAGRE
jgi:thiosulfate/3-mercaptopyruvate sulfurtransferase